MHFLKRTHDKTRIYAKGKTGAEGTAIARNTRQRKAAAATLPSDRNGFSSLCEHSFYNDTGRHKKDNNSKLNVLNNLA